MEYSTKYALFFIHHYLTSMEKSTLHEPVHVDRGPLVKAEIFPNEQSFLMTKNDMEGNGKVANVTLLLDTGSNISGLDQRIIERLQLKHYAEKSFVDGVGGRTSLNRYKCILYIDIFGNKALPIDILEGQFEDSPYDGIIGRDVLQFCRFEYNGPANSFTLIAPGF